MELKIRGGSIQIDDADYELIKDRHWGIARRPSGHCYAQTCVYAGKRNGKSTTRTVLLHRFLMGLSPGDGLVVDHINGDTLDNRRQNLRVTTQGKNVCNRVVKGAYPVGAKFMARIQLNGEKHYLGLFHTEAEAVAAYREAARRLHGEFSRV